MKRKNIKKIITISAIIGILFWVIYRFTVCEYVGIETETAECGELKDVMETTGVVVRDELTLTADSCNPSNLKYLLSDGEKISKNGVVAEVYSSSDEAKNSYKIDNINKEIEILEKLNLFRYNISKGINFINRQINKEIRNLLMFLDDMRFLDAKKSECEILYLLNEKQIVLGKDIDLDSRIQTLKEEKSRLDSNSYKSVSVITSPESGEFISRVDGYEDKIGYKNFLKADFKSLNFNDEIFNLQIPDALKTVGKIIKSETWYGVCAVTEEESQKIHVGEEVTFNILSLDSLSDIPCRIENVIKDPDSQKFLLVFSCDYMNKDLAKIRKENFEINLGEYSGLKVNKSAIHKHFGNDENFEMGVYIKAGAYLKFKKINPVFWGVSDVVCSYDSVQSADVNYLQSGDNVVVKGTNLYNNKRVG